MQNQSVKEKLAWLPPLPGRFANHYELGGYDPDRINRRIQAKYVNRQENLAKSWVRICTHMPETAVPGQKLRILELSTAHGAMLELWRQLGHDVQGADFAFPGGHANKFRPMKPRLMKAFNKTSEHPPGEVIPGWHFQPIIESLGLNVSLFDGGVTPYPWEDNAFDVVCSYQAIEAYAHCSEWDRIVDEMCRIARKTVVIGFNPPGLRGKNTSWDDMREAWEKLRNFDRNGFRNVFYEIEKRGRGVHPTTIKLMATG